MNAAPSKPSKPSKRGERPEGDQLQAALAAAAGPGDSAAAEAYTPGCVLKLMQLKSAKGADGKYTRLEPGRDLVALTRTRTLTLTLTLTLALALTP